MKRVFYLSLAFIFVFAAFASMASAAQNVANPTQKGSLLIFPKIEVAPDKDTIVEINNDYYKGVDVKCYWVNVNQDWSDFMFTITANQPVWFSARTGRGMEGIHAVNIQRFPLNDPVNGIGSGELKCWAVNAVGEKEISHNHLYGNATVFDRTTKNSIDYNSWNFTARGVARGKAINEEGGGLLLLSGATGAYDACPEFLVTDFIAKGGEFDLDLVDNAELTGVSTQLAISYCKSDVKQDRVATWTKLKFDVWSEDEAKYSGAWTCGKCWYEGYLDGIDNLADIFTIDVLGSPKGRLKAKGIASTECANSENVPVIGVIQKTFQDVDTSAALYVGASNTNGSGMDGTGWIKWDNQKEVDYPEAPKH